MAGRVDGIMDCLPACIDHTSMTRNKKIYKVQFQNHGQIYELYAREVSQSDLYTFVEVADIIFGEKSKLLVDPSEERMKAEFAQVNRTFIPLHNVIRIDEVEKEGPSKIIQREEGASSNVSSFPASPLPPKI